MDLMSVPVILGISLMRIFMVALIMMSVLLMLTTVMRPMVSVTTLMEAFTVLVRLDTDLMLITGHAMVSSNIIHTNRSNAH